MSLALRLDPKTVHAPEIGPVWLNSFPLTLRQLRGRVVLLDFFDYTCVNCLRTLPYLRAWHERYSGLGLTVIGIHAPEFYFGRSPEVLERALAELAIRYPVMLDNDYAVWKAFANRYWPSKYLVDAGGYMRYFHAGEGNYGEMEEAIQELLLEQSPGLALPSVLDPVRSMDRPGALAWCPRPTPELYLGHRRGRIANSGGFVEDKASRYTLGAGPQEDMPELGGLWNSLPDCLAVASEQTTDPSQLCLFYSAAEVNLVLSPSAEHPVARLDVRENGEPLPRDSWGEDIQQDAAGSTYLIVDRPRMYSLICRSAFGSALLQVSSASRGLQLFAFTFVSCLPEEEPSGAC